MFWGVGGGAAPHPRALGCPGRGSAAAGRSVCNQSGEQPGPAPEQRVEKGKQEPRGARAGAAEPGEQLPPPPGRDPSAGRRQIRFQVPCAWPSGTRRPAATWPWGPCPGVLGTRSPIRELAGTLLTALSPSSAMSRLLPVLLLAALGCVTTLKRRPAARDDGADAQRPPVKGCANLTLVLDNWKFAITSQMRNLLLFDHQTVLPDYGRIRSLSGALDHLYRDFSALKEQLGRLSARFAEVEAFADQLNRARGPGTPPRRRGLPQPARGTPDAPGGGTARRAAA
ncbi:Fanconi anemia core complex-associated protein 100 isoform 4-T4 [Alca torda]